MDSIENEIKCFTGYFEEQLSFLKDIKIEGQGQEANGKKCASIRLYQQIICVCMLDKLSGIKFNEKDYPGLKKHNRQRFIRFIKEYANWPEGELISIPFLKDKL